MATGPPRGARGSVAADGHSFFGAASDCNYTFSRDVAESMHLFVVHGKLFVRLCVPATPTPKRCVSGEGGDSDSINTPCFSSRVLKNSSPRPNLPSRKMSLK